MAALAGSCYGSCSITCNVTAITVAIANIWGGKWVNILGPIGIAVAIGATVGGRSNCRGCKCYKRKADDLLSEGDGTGGYGKRTLLGPEGAIALNNKDTIVAGTNLFPTKVMMLYQQEQEKYKWVVIIKKLISLLRTLVTQNKKKPSLSPVGLYEIQ